VKTLSKLSGLIQFTFPYPFVNPAVNADDIVDNAV
jgi:hypothetical protein